MEKILKFETEEKFLNIKNSLEYPQVSLTDDNSKVWVKSNKVQFTISGNHGDDVTFKFEVGMTWNDFAESQYNDGELEVYYDDKVAYDSHYMRLNEDASEILSGNDLIINGHIYYTEPN